MEDSAEGYSRGSSGTVGKEGSSESLTGSASGLKIDADEVTSTAIEGETRASANALATQSRELTWRERMQDTKWRVSQRMRHRLASRQAFLDLQDSKRKSRSRAESIDPYRGRIYDPDNPASSDEDEGAHTARSGGSRGSSRRSGRSKESSKGKKKKKKKKKKKGSENMQGGEGGTGSETDRSWGSRGSRSRYRSSSRSRNRHGSQTSGSQTARSGSQTARTND